MRVMHVTYVYTCVCVCVCVCVKQCKCVNVHSLYLQLLMSCISLVKDEMQDIREELPPRIEVCFHTGSKGSLGFDSYLHVCTEHPVSNTQYEM